MKALSIYIIQRSVLACALSIMRECDKIKGMHLDVRDALH
jgi:hypothetical protein